jgi:hypothetical protein
MTARDRASIDRTAEEINSLRPRLKAHGMGPLAVTLLLLDMDADTRAALLARLALCTRPSVRSKSEARK